MADAPGLRLVEMVERSLRQALDPPPAAAGSESPFWRHVRPCPPPEYATRNPLTVDAARQLIRSEIAEYLAMSAPEHMLLIRASAGVGKTKAGVEAAEAAAARGWRVAYAGPRHDFFADIQQLAGAPEQWYEWLPRQDGDDERPLTCHHTAAISAWLEKGYQGMDFCSRVCGWDYVNQSCPWHAQKRVTQPIVFVQHQHVAAGHPLEFRLLIGDENPMQSFLRQWRIPAERVLPRGMDPAEPLTEILHALTLAASGEPLQGPELLERLGGAAHVLDVLRHFALPAAVWAQVEIHGPLDAERADYFHLPQLVGLLEREAECAAQGTGYPARLIAGKGHLTLLLRREIDQRWPAHLIWLDATGSEHIYQELFGRPVQVVDAAPQLAGTITVVTDRANGKGLLVNAEESPRYRQQMAQLLDKLAESGAYLNPGLVTYQSALSLGEAWCVTHFYGGRGTNRLEHADIHFVVGTPMPALPVIRTMAAMIYFRRMRPFDSPWSTRWVAYHHLAEDGQGREYPAGGFWGDPDLQALVWQLREAELIQAVHRARPVHRDVPVYLLSNLPIPELPVARLATMAELLGTPDRIDPWEWQRFLRWLGERDSVTAVEIAEGMRIADNTAIKYRDALASLPGWELMAVKSKHGKPTKMVKRNNPHSY